MVPEALKGDKNWFSEKVDTYSYGIMLSELASCQKPYMGENNVFELPGKILNENLRPTIPKGCPDTFASLMKFCWKDRAEDRPDMEKVKKLIKPEIQQDRMSKRFSTASMQTLQTFSSTT